LSGGEGEPGPLACARRAAGIRSVANAVAATHATQRNRWWSMVGLARGLGGSEAVSGRG